MPKKYFDAEAFRNFEELTEEELFERLQNNTTKDLEQLEQEDIELFENIMRWHDERKG